jgi:8-oxo-dGTP pyrophosphatase MutT (NUDIX family)
VRSRLFWLISRLAIPLYRRFPIFGPLRGAVAIIRRDEGFVAVRRSDGLGLCFPGGNCRPWEPVESAVRREVLEETGLDLTRPEFKFCFHTSVFYPVSTSVFESEATGQLRGSWEGQATIATLAELEIGIIPTQRPIVDYIKSGGKSV